MSPVEKTVPQPEEHRLLAHEWAKVGPIVFEVAPEVVTAALGNSADGYTKEEVSKAVEEYKKAPATRG